MFIFKISDSPLLNLLNSCEACLFLMLLIAFSIDLGFPPPLEEVLFLFGLIYSNTFLLLVVLWFPKCFS